MSFNFLNGYVKIKRTAKILIVLYGRQNVKKYSWMKYSWLIILSLALSAATILVDRVIVPLPPWIVFTSAGIAIVALIWFMFAAGKEKK